MMRALVGNMRTLIKQMGFRQQLREIKKRPGEYGVQLNQVYDAMENMIDKTQATSSRVSFKVPMGTVNENLVP